MSQRFTKRVSFMVDEETFEAIEVARGREPREPWLRRAVRRSLEQERLITEMTPRAVSLDDESLVPGSRSREVPRAPQDPPKPVESPQKGSQGPTGQVSGRSEAELNRLQWLAAQQKARSR